VIEQTVAAPIENAITGVEKMIYMSSTSARTHRADPGHFRHRHERGSGDRRLNNRVKQAEARLPEEVRRQG